MSDFFESAIEVVRQAVEREYGGNVTKAAQALGVSVPSLHQWLSGNRKPSLAKLSPLLQALGVQLALPVKDAARDVCFVNARIVDTVKNGQPPEAVDYIAAPLVGEVGAGPGYIPGNEVKSWFLVYSNLPAVRYRKNLIAVELGKNSTSMRPTLNPGDLVLVDRDDRDVTRPGHIMLVMDPLDNSGIIKRVSVRENGKDFAITYYSDNAAQYPPMIYSLQKDFDGDWDKAVIGRVIWAWQDMREK